MAEWLKATVLKTVDGKPSQSSNLCSSAILKKPAAMRAFCFSAFTQSEKTSPCSSVTGLHLTADAFAAIVQSRFLQTSGDFPMQAELHCAVIRSLAG